MWRGLSKRRLGRIALACVGLALAGLIAAFKERADSLFGRVLLLVLGMLSCYIPGTLWLMMLTGRTAAEALPLAVYPFLPGDAVKIIAAAVLAPKLREALRRAA